ncbi:TonB-dependent receptor [Sphingomonas sp. MAH-20]|uniref:TonB-dependent receptor n=1 Tax=Sphingomonas horti TaxID=2682842 RepID=A0A6I4J169_9SPHN|nr:MULTISPECIES: TonB-dependent receptor [Sphingomonas]MBA2919951.1 TonB-dependent receptor [Sphingomonas sp. CGMCC 1.13658]MVO77833.1 TonB-dependent receptor [Sphingomonas horti]
MILVSVLAAAAVAGSAQTAVADMGDALDTIVVTAQKREQSLHDVPLSIDVVDAAALDRGEARDLRAAATRVPNVSIQRQGAIDTVFVRGIGGGGRNIGFTTRAGVYVDGVYAGQFASVNQDALDIARIEFLRGPQGHLFGRNTDSGAISIVTEAPGHVFGGSLQAGYGNKDLFELRGTLNAPLSDQVAIRVSGSHRERDGFTLNVPTGTDLDNINRDSARGRMRAEFGDVTLDLAADYSHDRTNKAIGEALTDTFNTGPSPLPGAFDTPYNVDPLQRIRTGGGSATIGWALGQGLSLTSITGYRGTSWHRRNDLDYVPLDLAMMDYRDRFAQTSQEVRLNFASDRLNGVAGLYVFDETARTDRRVIAGSQVGLLPFGLAPGLSAQVLAQVKTRSYAAFGAADWRFADTLTLNIGGRFTHDRLRLDDYSSFGSPVFGLGRIEGFADRQSNDSFDPSVALSWAATPDLNLYARYAHGYKSGGWNVDFLSAAQFADRIRFTPERVNSAEAGLKFARPGLRLALAGYYTTIGDYQIDQFVDLGAGQVSLQLRNATKARSWGSEASLEARPVERLNLSLGVGYAHATFDRFPDGGGPGVDLDGNRLPYAPRLTASGELRYGIPLASDLKLDLSGDWTYRSASFSGPENLARQRIDARHLLGARAALVGGRFEVAGWVRNLLDTRYVDNRIFDFFGTQAVERGEPRTYGVTLTLRSR